MRYQMSLCLTVNATFKDYLINDENTVYTFLEGNMKMVCLCHSCNIAEVGHKKCRQIFIIHSLVKRTIQGSGNPGNWRWKRQRYEDKNKVLDYDNTSYVSVLSADIKTKDNRHTDIQTPYTRHLSIVHSTVTLCNLILMVYPAVPFNPGDQS